VITSVSDHSERVDKPNFRIINMTIDRGSINPLSAIRTVIELTLLLRKEKPNIVHVVGIKPILLGGLAALLAGVKGVVHAFVGGGYLFISASPLIRIFRPMLLALLRFVLNSRNSWVIFENADDLTFFVSKQNVRSKKAILIKGAGVDPRNYCRRRTPNMLPLVVLPARILWDKGIGVFIGAARLLLGKGVAARFVIVGEVDASNRSSISSAVVEAWRAEGVVEFWGFHSDMPQVFAQSDIVCLPSYREGLPKALLEGMAAGLPCVTTDVPGCREAVRDGDNGFLVPAKDVPALADAIQTLLLNPSLARRMGERGRQRVEQEFSEKIVNKATLQLYQEVLESRTVF
jgi:glycosyltransferase involved in cell wall biosynthesis